MSVIKLRKSSNSLGAEVIGLNLKEVLDPSIVQALKSAWQENLVLIFRGVHYTDDELLILASYFGEIFPPGPNILGRPYLPDCPNVSVISNILDGGLPIGGLGSHDLCWHNDMTCIATPPAGIFLHALEIPETGGNTSWGNMCKAYDDLSLELKIKIANREANHDIVYNSAGLVRPGQCEVADPREAPGAHHPLVILHPVTGRPALFLGRRRNSFVLGMDSEESNALLDELWAHASQEKYTCTHVWEQHDLVLWDNLATMHRRDAFNEQERRVLHRVQIKGTVLSAHRIDAV